MKLLIIMINNIFNNLIFNAINLESNITNIASTRVLENSISHSLVLSKHTSEIRTSCMGSLFIGVLRHSQQLLSCREVASILWDTTQQQWLKCIDGLTKPPFLDRLRASKRSISNQMVDQSMISLG